MDRTDYFTQGKKGYVGGWYTGLCPRYGGLLWRDFKVHSLTDALRILSDLLGCKLTTAVSHQGEVHFLTDVFRIGIDLPIVLVSSISHVEVHYYWFTHGGCSQNFVKTLRTSVKGVITNFLLQPQLILQPSYNHNWSYNPQWLWGVIGVEV